jgi:hypothetical protein
MDDAFSADSDDIPKQDSDRRIHSAEIRKEIELMVQAELVVIQQRAAAYAADHGGNFPPGIHQLYLPPSFYLRDESYRRDAWGNDYVVEGTQFKSRGPDGANGGGDDIYPL